MSFQPQLYAMPALRLLRFPPSCCLLALTSPAALLMKGQTGLMLRQADMGCQQVPPNQREGQ